MQNTMSFDPDTQNTQTIQIGNIRTDLSVWIKSTRNANFNDNVAAVLTLDQGNFHVHVNMNEHDASALIDALHQHIANIKAAEIELIALMAKVEA